MINTFFIRIIAAILSLVLSVIAWIMPAAANTVKISFDANPSTGYTWVCEMDKEGVVKIADEYYRQPFSITPVVGAGGTYTYIFAPVADGEATLTFFYMRTWEGKDSAAEIVNYTFTVANGRISAA